MTELEEIVEECLQALIRETAWVGHDSSMYTYLGLAIKHMNNLIVEWNII